MNPEEHKKLELLARRPKTSQALAMQARIVLNCATDPTNDRVAEKPNVTRPTAGKWRERFRLDRLEGLWDEPRPGAPRSITDDEVEKVVITTPSSARVRFDGAGRCRLAPSR